MNKEKLVTELFNSVDAPIEVCERIVEDIILNNISNDIDEAEAVRFLNEEVDMLDQCGDIFNILGDRARYFVQYMDEEKKNAWLNQALNAYRDMLYATVKKAIYLNS